MLLVEEQSAKSSRTPRCQCGERKSGSGVDTREEISTAIFLGARSANAEVREPAWTT